MRILIVQTAFIGDVILITPLIKAVYNLYPDSLIDVMVVPAAAKLLENNSHINKVISYPKRSNALISMLQMIALIRGNRYNMVISPHSSARTHLILFLSKIPIRIGFDRGLLPWLLTARIPHPQGIHKIQKNLNLLKPLSNKTFSLQSELFPWEQDILKAESILKTLQGKELIAIAPGSIWATKCWLIEYYQELAISLTDKGFGLVLIGAEADREKCDAVESVLPKGTVVNLAGKTNLLESAAVIAICHLMLCNDSGALHIANAMQTRVFAFFGPTVQHIGYYPFRGGDRVFETELPCRPCSSHGPQKCPLKHHNCMRLTKPETAYNAILEAFGERKSP